MREPTRFATLLGQGGLRLHAEVFLPDRPRGVVLVTHGYAEHCGRYRELADVLANAGWAVLTYDVRGHGQSGGERGYCDRFSQYLEDFRVAHRAARELAAGPLIALGHSHGSLITLRVMLEPSPPQATALVLSSPFLGFHAPVPAAKALLGKVASRLLPHLTLPSGLRVQDLTSDLGKQAERTRDKLCFEIATARWFTEAVAAQREVEAGASRLSLPALWLIGGADPIASAPQSKKVATSMPRSTVHVLDGYLHEVFNETNRAQVFEELVRFLAAQS